MAQSKIQQIQKMWTNPVSDMSLLPVEWELNVRYLVGEAEPYQEYLWDVDAGEYILIGIDWCPTDIAVYSNQKFVVKKNPLQGWRLPEPNQFSASTFFQVGIGFDDPTAPGNYTVSENILNTPPSTYQDIVNWFNDLAVTNLHPFDIWHEDYTFSLREYDWIQYMVIDQSSNQLLDPDAVSPVNNNLYERIEIYAVSNNPNQQWTFPGVVAFTWDNDTDANWFQWLLYETIDVKWCELITLWNKDFDCKTDELIFISNSTTQNIDWEVFGWSSPEWIKWSNIPSWDNRSWSVWITVETDWLGSSTFWPIVNTYSSFSWVIDELNNMLISYGSSLRLLWWVDGNRIFVTRVDGTIIVWDTDSYLTTVSYVNMEVVIEDSVTNNDWLIKWINPKWFIVNNVVASSWSGGMFRGKIPCSWITVPTPQISILSWFWSTWSNSISFVAKYNESDRWILDYEPEIYLYFKKKRRGTNSGWRHNIRYRHKLAHSPQSLWWSSTSLKKDVNPRLNASTNSRVVTTEWLVDWTQTDMTTIFTLSPFQFLGSIAYGDAWTWTFPMLKSDWNKNWNGTLFPSTFTTKSISKQDSWQWRPVTHMTAYFKTVIRNPKWGHPIESAESYPIIIYPDVHINQTWSADQYAHWWVNINYNTR